jgi:LemA protein
LLAIAKILAIIYLFSISAKIVYRKVFYCLSKGVTAMTTLLIVLLVLAAVVGVGILWFIGGYNTLVRLHALVQEGWSGIDVQLKRRYDLIPNLVAVVKQYSIHEQSVLENVTKMRSISMQATSVEGKAQAEAGLQSALKTLFAVAENYPNLKANENFMSLQKTLADIENDIQLARRYYNGTVRNYATKRASFPTVIIASFTGFGPEAYFEIGQHERENVRIQF